MKIIISEFNNNINLIKYFNHNNICFIDIETTGLSRNYNSIYLIGLLYYNEEKKSWILKQLFAESIDEEKELLVEFMKLVSNYERIITYNGDSFDIPFINAKLKYYNIEDKISNEYSLDLYKIVRKNRYFLNLENLRLKTLEKSLGINREDIYSGKDCITFYLNYIATKNEELKERVLKHNYDDLYYMIYIIRILDIIEQKKSLKLTYNNKELTLFIEDISVSGDVLILNGSTKYDERINMIYYHDNYKIIFDNENKFEISIEFSIGLVSSEEKGYYVEKKKLALSNEIKDSTSYNLPNDILLLKVDKEYCMENIKVIIGNLVTKSLDETS